MTSLLPGCLLTFECSHLRAERVDARCPLPTCPGPASPVTSSCSSSPGSHSQESCGCGQLQPSSKLVLGAEKKGCGEDLCRQRPHFLFSTGRGRAAFHHGEPSCRLPTGRCCTDQSALAWVYMWAQPWEYCASASQVRRGSTIMVVCVRVLTPTWVPARLVLTGPHSLPPLGIQEATSFTFLSVHYLVCRMGM